MGPPENATRCLLLGNHVACRVVSQVGGLHLPVMLLYMCLFNLLCVCVVCVVCVSICLVLFCLSLSSLVHST